MTPTCQVVMSHTTHLHGILTLSGIKVKNILLVWGGGSDWRGVLKEEKTFAGLYEHLTQNMY